MYKITSKSHPEVVWVGQTKLSSLASVLNRMQSEFNGWMNTPLESKGFRYRSWMPAFQFGDAEIAPLSVDLSLLEHKKRLNSLGYRYELASRRRYREKNRAIVNQKRRDGWLNPKPGSWDEKARELVQCDCGGLVQRGSLLNHKKRCAR